MGTHDFKYNKLPFFCSKNREYQYYDVCPPKLAHVPASRYYCVVTRSYHNVRGSFKKFPDCFHYLNVSCRIQIEIICGER